MKRNYFAIIPSHIRYDNDLIPNAKLMFGELTALSNDKGYCYATNKYFSELYNVSKVSVSKWINQLKNKGYIKVELVYENKEIKERKIYIVNPDEVLKINLTGNKPKLKDNSNTIYNNKEVKFYNQLIQDSFPHIVDLFPKELQPKTIAQKNQWLDCLDKLERLDGYDPRMIYYIVKRVREDEFWKDNFYSILKLRKKNKYEVKYIDMFKTKFAKGYVIN